MSDHPHEVAVDRYLTVLALDIERFGRFTDAQSTRVATTFRNAVEQAFEHAGLADTYATHAFMQNAGDGIVAGFDEARLPQIVDRLPNALQFGLRELHQQDGLGVRMRMGISYGPVQGIADRRVDVAPNRTIVDACRIADAEQTRGLLRRSDPEATFLAVAITAPVMDFTVGRNPLWLRESELVETEVAIASKDYRTRVFLHVPAPSGELLRAGMLGGERPEPEPHPEPALEERVERAAAESNTVRGEAKAEGGQAAQIGRVGGDFHQVTTGAVSGPGAIGAVTGGRVNQHHTHVGGDQFSGNRDAMGAGIAKEPRPADGKHRRESGWKHP